MHLKQDLASVEREEAVNEARRKAVELRAIRDGLIAAPEPDPETVPWTFERMTRNPAYEP